MQVVKCPRCDINFMREGEECCKICLRDLKGMALKANEPEMCAECGENPALFGEDICADCLKERKLLHEESRKPIGKRKPVVANDQDELVIDDDEIEEPIETEDIEGDELVELDIDLVIDEEPDDELVDLDEVESLDEMDDEVEDDFDSDDPMMDSYEEDESQDDYVAWSNRERRLRAE